VSQFRPRAGQLDHGFREIRKRHFGFAAQVHRADRHPASRIDELLPHRWRPPATDA
jgi:uncharacterized protein YuzE